MGKTVWQVMRKSDGVTVRNEADKLCVSMTPSVWEHTMIYSNQFPCEEKQIYRLQISADGGDADLRLLIQFHGKEGVMGYRCYVNKDCEITVPEGMDRFDISAVITTDKPAEVMLGQIAYQHLREAKPKNVRLCGISDEMIPSECKKNQADLVEAYCRVIDQVVTAEKPDLVVLTEHFHNICEPPLPIEEKFVDYSHEAVTRIAQKAKEHGIYISGSFHILENGCRYNRAILFDRKGEIIATYDKTHIIIMEYEMGIKPGNEITVVDTDIGRLGFIICWDLYFPELLRMYHLAGCDIIINPTRGNALAQNHAASYTSGTYLVASAFPKVTRVQDKMGNVLDEAGDKGYAVATVDVNAPAWRANLSVVAAYGEGRNIFLRERRPEMYEPLCK